MQQARGYVDPGWEHGTAQDERKKKVKCNYCGKVVSGGIFRLKQHLARLSGEVTHCEKVPEEVCLNMRKNLEGCHSGRKRRRSDYEQAALSIQSNEYSDGEDASASYKHKGKRVMGDKNLVIKFTPLRSLGYIDPGWEHCVAQDEKKRRVKCNYCEKIISGGINRFKQHLARIPGEVAYCEKAPEEVYLKIKENMKWHRTGRKHQKPDTKEISTFYLHSDNEDEGGEEEGYLQSMSKDMLFIDDKVSDNDVRNNVRGRSPGSSGNGAEPLLKKSRLDSVFLKSLKSQTSAHYKPSRARIGFENKAHREVISAICKFFYHAGIPSNAANSPYFNKMLELVGQYGQGLQGPSSRLISGRLLQEEIANIKDYLVELKTSWAITGCSVMADSWNDAQGRTLINFLVSCPRGVYFLSSVDASDMIEDAVHLFKLLDKAVDEVGEEFVVQVITRNTSSFRNAGKMLEEKRRNLFWTPCAVYCIDRMLEDFVNIKWSLLDQRVGLKRMFQSNKWLSSRFAKLDEGKEIERIVLNVSFWKKLQYVKKSLEPVAEVLQKIGSDKIRSMPFIYSDICRTKLAIKSIHGGDVRKYGPFWSVIDSNWSSLFHHPLYVAAYFLNPSYQYRPDFLMNPEVMRGLNECIVRLEADDGKKISASMQIPDFESAKADFGTDLAISTRNELDPASWWQQHGISCLELQRIAIRILSQTCSSIGCEHNWSAFDQVHIKRCNCLSRKRLNDQTFVHYNLRLRERQLGTKPDELVSFDSAMLESVLDDWLVETEKLAIPEDEEIIYNEMEQFCGDDIDEHESEEKRPTEMVTISGFIEPLDFIPCAGVLSSMWLIKLGELPFFSSYKFTRQKSSTKGLWGKKS
ncbi:hypothetical protein V6N12_037471 [Hibiscus sabdariffa]|uniref:BED-type domain-containing protein n=1 Tax=Hibiscus sabdariffa TaxID=183260 RepID=A0ABR2AUQ8_9ROSI